MNFNEVTIETMNELYEIALLRLQSLPYKLYLQTEHWKHFRAEALKHEQYKCQLCNSKDKELNVHHRSYENIGRETFNDVIVLCKDCHEKFHSKEICGVGKGGVMGYEYSIKIPGGKMVNSKMDYI